MNPNVCFNARIVNNGCSCISPRISDQRFAMHSDSLHTDNNWNNWFHFQYDRLWPVNMTGKTKSWLVNSPISPDIVGWLAVISSPDFPLLFYQCHFVYLIKRILHGGLKIWILFSRGKNNFCSLTALISKILFCHSKIKFISSRHGAISSIYIVVSWPIK